MTEELKAIKKIYGEQMMHLCRTCFPTILEKPGMLLSILGKNLAQTHSLAPDIYAKNLEEEFKDWVYSFIDVEREYEPVTTESPFELMDEAGYILFECKSEEEIQSFKKYYEPDEELCTFNGGRLNRCHVFFAIKKNVDEIKRENFPNPKRQDEYGTSVISIQFSKGKTHDISIKNRYNHTVNFPDSTFANNLDNIIPGLTQSFENYCDFKIGHDLYASSSFLSELGFVRGGDGKYYRSNIEVNAINYCENNIIINDGEVITKYAENKEQYIVIDQFVVDLKDKMIMSIDPEDNDAFIQSINDAGIIKDIRVIKDGEERIIKVTYLDNTEANIIIDRHNAIIGYSNNKVMDIENDFLVHNETLKGISLPNVLSIGSNFLLRNKIMKKISLPKVQYILDKFMFNCESLLEVDLPEVLSIEESFLFRSTQIENICLPKLERLKRGFLGPLGSGRSMFREESGLRRVDLPNLVIVPDFFLSRNNTLVELNLPKAQVIGHSFLFSNQTLKKIDLPEAVTIGYNFMPYNEEIESISFPKAKEIGYSFLSKGKGIKKVYLPEVEKIGKDFLGDNVCLEEAFMPNLKEIGESYCVCLKEFIPSDVLSNKRGR